MNLDLTPLEIALLDDAGSVNDLSIAYGTVQPLKNPSDRNSLSDLTEAALLKLFDQRLVMFFRASRHEGYGAAPSEMTALSREEIVGTLEADRDPEFIPDEDNLVFFVATDAGREFFGQLTSDSVLRPSGRIDRPWEH